MLITYKGSSFLNMCIF